MSNEPAHVATLNGQEIIISPWPKNDVASGMYRTLPECKWDKHHCVWRATATPAAAWRLCTEKRFPLTVCDGLKAMGLKLHSGLTGTAANAKAMSGFSYPNSKTAPWQHQVKGVRFAYPRSATLESICMGGGKSKVTVDLMNSWDARSILISSPLSVCNVWLREFETHSYNDYEVLILNEGSVPKRAERLAEILYKGSTHRKVVCVNYDAAWRDEIGAMLKSITWDAIACDESHRIKADKSAVSKFFAGLRAEHKLCLTGTPMPHSPLDLFGQFRFLDVGVFGDNYTLFRAEFAKMNPRFPGMVDEWVNEEELKRRFALMSYSITKEEALPDLPKVMHMERTAKPSPAMKRVYESIQRELWAQLQSGEMTVANALVKSIRLQQCCSGYAVDDDGTVNNLSSEKQDLLEEILQDIGPGEPVVVFGWFKEDMRRIEEVAKRLKLRYGEVSGSRKDGLDDRARMRTDIDLCGTQIAAGAEGIDLTRARYGIFYARTWTHGKEDQAVARLSRPGQTRPTFFYHLTLAGTVDEKMRKAVSDRRSVADAIMSAIR